MHTACMYEYCVSLHTHTHTSYVFFTLSDTWMLHDFTRYLCCHMPYTKLPLRKASLTIWTLISSVVIMEKPSLRSAAPPWLIVVPNKLKTHSAVVETAPKGNDNFLLSWMSGQNSKVAAGRCQTDSVFSSLVKMQIEKTICKYSTTY